MKGMLHLWVHTARSHVAGMCVSGSAFTEVEVRVPRVLWVYFLLVNLKPE